MSTGSGAAQEDLSAALRRAEAQFALAERAANIGAWRYDLRTGATAWSPGLYALMGLDPARMSLSGGNWVMNQIEPDDVKAIEAEVTRAIKTRTPFHYRARSRAERGPVAVIDTHGEVEYDADGQPAALLAVARNVTPQIDAENAGRRAEQWYRCMADQASDIIILFSADAKVLYASNALGRMLGRKPEDVDGQKFLDYVHPEDIEEARKVASPPAPGETIITCYRTRHQDGHYIWMEVSLRGIYDDRGTLLNFIAVARDITERKRREDEAKAVHDEAVAANAAKSLFLANMSHELRTPLNAIIGFADVMRQQMFGPLGAERYADYARLIHESGELLLELISDVLDMAKVEAGKLELHLEPLQIGVIAEDCLSLMGERARLNQIALVKDISPGVPLLQADRRAVKQILLNLLSNAVKFTLPGGQVSLRTVPQDGGLCLIVQDNGVGIPAQDLPRLGHAFEQAHSDATRSAGGAGLGLALVRALAEKHGGWMALESQEGTGTTVTVWLPLEQTEAVKAA